MFTRITIQNFLSFSEAAELELAPVTALAGKNASGKSNILTAILTLVAKRGAESPTIYFGRRGGIARIAAELSSDLVAKVIKSNLPNPHVRLVLEIREGTPQHLIEIAPSPDVRPSRINATLGAGTVSGGSDWGPVEINTGQLGDAVRPTFLFSAERIVHQPATGAQGSYELAADCSNLFQVLNTLAASDPDKATIIATHARALLPELATVRVAMQQGSNTLDGRIIERWLDDPQGFRWDQAATGTRHLIALLTLLIVSPEGSLLLIEEPESFLHPDVCVRLVRLFHSVANDGKRLIVTTHSPFIMESVGSKQLAVVVRNTESGESGIVMVPRLAERALAERGVLRSFMLAPVLRAVIPACILIVEGADDEAIWRAWIATSSFSDDTIMIVKGDEEGGGEGGAKRLAVLMRHAADAGISTTPFFLTIDSDGNRKTKMSKLREELLATDFHVLERQCIEDYLLDPAALAITLGVAESAANEAIRASRKVGKDRFAEVVRSLSKQQRIDAKFKGQVAAHVSPADEIAGIIEALGTRVAQAR